MLQAAPGKILFRFHSHDLHLGIAPTEDGKPVRFKVTLDGLRPATIVDLIQPLTAPARFASLVSINSSAKRAKSKIVRLKWNSSTPAFRLLTSRLVRKFGGREIRPGSSGRDNKGRTLRKRPDWSNRESFTLVPLSSRPDQAEPERQGQQTRRKPVNEFSTLTSLTWGLRGSTLCAEG